MNAADERALMARIAEKVSDAADLGEEAMQSVISYFAEHHGEDITRRALTQLAEIQLKHGPVGP